MINNHLNQASWKGININRLNGRTIENRKQQTNRGLFYMKETVSGDETSYSTLNYIMNIHWLKIPLYFNYHYDSNLSSFEVKITKNIRGILMTNTSQSFND